MMSFRVLTDLPGIWKGLDRKEDGPCVNDGAVGHYEPQACGREWII